MWAFSSCGKRGLLFIAMRRLLTVVASLLQCTGCRFEGFSSCGIMGLVVLGMWDLPGPGIEPVFLPLQGGFLTTGPPGKP